VIAYKQIANNGVLSLVTLWQHQLEPGRRAECVTVLPPDSTRASLLPTGASTATGTSKNGSGNIETISSGGTTTGAAETAAVPRTVRGTDIDNDGDTDVVVGGGLDAAGLLPSGPAGFIQVIQRGATGGLSIATPVQFVTGPVLQMIPAGSTGVITFTQSPLNLTGGVDVDRTEFVAAVVEGDLDGDGLVGTSDTSILLLDFGRCPDLPCPSDVDGSGEVDSGDISLLLLLFS
jgi:hypothetical protein